MENQTDMLNNQQQKITSVLGYQSYPGSGNLFQFNPSISPTRLDNSSVCSNPQFQNIPPFGMPFQPGPSDFLTNLNTQNIPQTSSQFPQFGVSNSTLENPFNSPSNVTQNPLKSSSLFANNIPFNMSPNISQFIPTKVTNNFSFGSLRGNEEIIQFPFSTGNFGFKNRGKRRTDLAELENTNLPPAKQHITEEKMAEHMSRLHINSETAPSPIEPESVKNKRLYMCEEMRKLQTDPILPPCLLRERPCTALVLWQPPSKVLNIASSSGDNNNCDDDESGENNNESRLVDRNGTNNLLNTMDMDV